MPSRGFDFGTPLIAICGLILAGLGVASWGHDSAFSLLLLGIATLVAVAFVITVRGRSKLDRMESDIMFASLRPGARPTPPGTGKR